MEQDFIGIGACALILNDKNENLLLRRTNKTEVNVGLWAVPGGRVEFGEEVTSAVKREVKEEVNLNIEIMKFLNYTQEIGKGGHIIVFTFLAKITDGKPKNMEPHKHDEMKWFPLSKLPENLTVYTRNSVNAYLDSK